jgi:HD superfamily phosphohydrolase
LREYLPHPKNLSKGSPKVIHDGLWGTLKLSPLEVAFLDTPLLQRLRQIRQMGCAYLTYPSTTHSRLEHTLGVMLQIERLGKALVKRRGGTASISEGDVSELRIAALLHDVGHGPFSHTSEEVYGSSPQFESVMNDIGPAKPHEILTYLILTSKRFKGFCEEVSGGHSTMLRLDEIAPYIVGKCPPSARPYKRELLNGPFDADKLDYLIRDSHFSGIPLSVDLDRLWYSVLIAKAKGEYHLAVNQSGAGALEQVLFAKMNLFTTLYHHHKIRACDCMFMGIIEYMRENDLALPIRNRELRWESPADYLWATDGEFLSFGFRTSDDRLHRLVHNLFFRHLLKRALVLSRKTIKLKEEDRWDELQRLTKRGAESLRRRRELAGEIWNRAGNPCLKQEIWVDLPELPTMSAASDTFVVPARGRNSKAITLNEIFPTAAWTQQYGMNKWRGHVFCPEECRDKVARAAREVLEEKYDTEILNEAFLWCKVSPPQRALLDSLLNVSCDDVRAMVPPVLRHRIFTNFNADAEGVTVEDIVKRLLETVPEPSEADYR